MARYISTAVNGFGRRPGAVFASQRGSAGYSRWLPVFSKWTQVLRDKYGVFHGRCRWCIVVVFLALTVSVIDMAKLLRGAGNNDSL